ncbi:MAG TPA: polyketide synthase dehydratase domain-containing protein, partial [Stellaceae bacterium]|nr:polyketide synthase dehydratase domain-containing protein [Stellaceae bacterium]
MLGSEDSEWELSSRPRLSDEPLTLHAVARLVTAAEGSCAAPLAQCGPPQRVVDGDALYRLAARLGLDYGSRFRTVTKIEVLGPQEALAHLDPTAIGEPLDAYLIHPALLDGALQALLALITDAGVEGQGISLLPWRFGRVRLAAPFGRSARYARLRVTRIGTRSASADIALFDESGAVIAELTDCWFRKVELTRRGATDSRALHVDLVPAPLVEAPAPAIFERIGETVMDLAGADRGASANAAERALLLDAVIASVAYQSLLAVAEPGSAFEVDELIGIGTIASDAAALVDQSLRLLMRFGAARRDGDGWRLLSEHDLPEVGEVWRLLLGEAPELVAELALVAAAAEDLPRVITGGLRPSDLSPLPMVEHLLHASPVSAAGIDLICAAIGEIAAAWPDDRPLRVLELGATGGATRRVLEILAQSGVALRYRAANPDEEQAARLAFVVDAVPGASASCWSPGGENDDLGDSRFDVILSVQAGARLQIDAPALSQLHGLLIPGGLLLAVEPEPNPLWDIVFGRSLGWWQTDSQGGDGSPLRTGEAWRRDLAIAGFATPGSANVATGPWPSTVFWARTPPAIEPAIAPQAAASIHLIVADGNRSAFGDRLAQAGYRINEIDGDAFAALDTAETDREQEGQEEIALLVIEEGDDPVVQSAELIALAARVAAAAAQRGAPLWLVTHGAQQADGGTDTGLVGAALWGFARVLLNEMPRLALHLVDFAPALTEVECVERLSRELAAGTSE